LTNFDEDESFMMQRKMEYLVRNSVFDTTDELSGEKQLEKQMKKSV